MHIIEEIEQNRFKVITGYDECHWLFDELWENGVSFISNHRDYADKGELSHIRIEALMDGDIPQGYEAVKVYAYIHGNIALSVNKFNCPWDSGFMGYLLFKTGEFGENNIGVEGFIRHWQAVLNGEIYFFTIEDENQMIESCGGFDDYDYMKKEIDSIINSMLQLEHKKKVERLKTMIKHRVPLEKRA